MKIPYSWLKEYVDFDASPEELADRLTFSGLEVEAINTVGSEYKGVVVGEVREVGAHPGADRLKLCRVYDGSEEKSVVCGAHNYEVGDKVPFAGVGAVLPDGTKIKKARIRGEVSHGMMCSESELGISADHSGIMILDGGSVPGTEFSQIMGSPETVLELEVTWNRPDCLSIIGVAREVAALYGTQVKLPGFIVEEGSGPVDRSAEVKVEDAQACPRYTARVLSGIKIGPSPAWMQRRLAHCGIRPINNIVDITNYVLLECGQPLHAFDYEMLAAGDKAEVLVRQARRKEKITTLDGIERELADGMLVITDGKKPVAVAGVMGGEGSEVLENTTRVLLESACFDPASIRKTSSQLGLSSESSHRFERGVDIALVEWASARAASLMAELAGGVVDKGVIDVYPDQTKGAIIILRFQRVRDLIGLDISAKEMLGILRSLGMDISGESDDSCMVEAPVYRRDISIEADLIEEIARMYGLDKVSASVPKSLVVPDADDSTERAVQKLREAAAGLGLSEIVNYSFVSDEMLARFGISSEEMVALPDPVSKDHGVLRASLLPQVAQALAGNLAHQVETAGVFETGRVFVRKKKGGMPEEEDRFCLGLMGNVGGAASVGNKEVSNEEMFLWAKGIIEGLVSFMKVPTFRLREAEGKGCPAFRPDAVLSVVLDGVECGVLGLLNDEMRASWRMPGPVALAEIRVGELTTHAFDTPVLAEIPSFPAVTRDMALLVSQDVTHEDVMNIITKNAPAELTDVRLFDIYTGEGIEAGKKSLAYSLVYRSLERTLTDEDANGYHETIKSALENELKVEIR